MSRSKWIWWRRPFVFPTLLGALVIALAAYQFSAADDPTPTDPLQGLTEGQRHEQIARWSAASADRQREFRERFAASDKDLGELDRVEIGALVSVPAPTLRAVTTLARVAHSSTSPR